MTLNLQQVADDLWRSGQPIAADWPELFRMGIRRVLKLNDPNVGDPDVPRALGMQLSFLHITDHEAQTVLSNPLVLTEIDRLIDIRGARGAQGLLVHCTEGVDRAGIAIARWRVRRCGWSKQAAWDEWVVCGSHGYHGLVEAWHAWMPACTWSESPFDGGRQKP